jgi:hypothetical protein
MLGFLRENSAVQKMIATRYPVIFYAENAYYFQYFRRLFEALRERKVKICYITSDRNDPVLAFQDENTDVVFSKSTLAFAFSRLQADLVIMTMPDLGQYLFKRSKAVKKYLYLFHALVSTHQQYRLHAFDHYDTILLAGPHQEREIREAEARYDLPQKELVPYGYPLLDDLVQKSTSIPVQKDEILIAPSWYEQGILQTCIHPLVKVLAVTNYTVRIRPHPEFIKRNKQAFRQLETAAKKNSRISIDTKPSLLDSLLQANHLITDRSGIAFEFTLVRNSPVIFIDTPLKVQNPEAGSFRNEPVENSLRGEMGICVNPADLSTVVQALERAKGEQALFAQKISTVREAVVYPAEMQEHAIEYIMQQLG